MLIEFVFDIPIDLISFSKNLDKTVSLISVPILKDSSPIKTACNETAVGSATGASFLSNPFGIS